MTFITNICKAEERDVVRQLSVKDKRKPLQKTARLTALAGATALVSALFVPGMALAAKPAPTDKATPQLQGELSKAVKYFKSKKYAQGTQAVESITSAAPDTSACLYALQGLEAYGAPAAKAKRACLEKALNLARTPEELLEVALKARQNECFDVSKSALDSLVGASTDFGSLLDIAHKAHEHSVSEVAHVAMQKAYSLVSNVPDALLFAREAHSIGLDDLSRNALKDLIEDQPSTEELILLLPKFAGFEMTDIVRLDLKRALERSKTVEDYLLVYNASKRYEQDDITKLASYRGRKLTLINKIKEEKGQPDRAREKALEEKERKAKEEMMRATGQTPSGF
jgi:hypothetical protein